MKQSRPHAHDRGIAILTVVLILIVLSLLVEAAIMFSRQDNLHSGKHIHTTSLQDLTEATLQFGRGFFSQNYPTWNTYLGFFVTSHTFAQVLASHPELIPPLPAGVTGYNCYTYAKDDADELPPAVNNPGVDNNLRIFVGAVCIQTSGTNGALPLQAELSAPLEDNPAGNAYVAQGSGGSQGLNNMSTMPGYR